MQIKVHRGTHQVGGCVTEIKTKNARIIIDMGAELPTSENTENTDITIDGVTVGAPSCDGVFITHYHGDHIGMIDKILPNVPVYMGKTAKKIHLCLQKAIKKKIGTGNPELVETLLTFTAGKKYKIKDITITPLCVDHSAFDAYAFLIESEGKRILHTGDFRMHGARGSKMSQVFEKYANNLDALITEGTLLGRPAEKVMTEHELSKEAAKLMKRRKNTFVLCSSTNIDRIAAFYNAAIASNKPFIVCDFQADILNIVTENTTSSFYDFTRQKVYTYGKNLHNMMKNLGFCMMIRANYASQRAIKEFPDSVLIYSMWAGYLDKNRPAYDEHKSNFIEEAKVGGAQLIHLHTSGHATAEDIKKLCEITKPKMVIPIHVEEPLYFNQLGIKNEIKILNDGECFEI